MNPEVPNINVIESTWRRVKKGHIKVRDLKPVKDVKGGVTPGPGNKPLIPPGPGN
jgi:hypothetical protein